MAEASVLTGGDLAANPNPAGDPAAGNHWSAGLDDETKGWVTGKGFDKLDSTAALPELVKGWRGAEKTLGVPADQVVRLPGEKATPEEIKAFHTKLGVPDTPDGYQLPVPEGQAGDFAKTAAGWMHEAGVPKAAAAKLATKWNEHVANMQVAQDAKFDQQASADIDTLKGTLGDNYDKTIDLAKRVSKTMGLNAQEAQAVERVLGIKRTVEVFSKFGGALGEHRFAGNGDGSQSFGMSPEAAKARITDLRKDGEWMAKYTTGDADKKAEWTRLHQIAFPEQAAA